MSPDEYQKVRSADTNDDGRAQEESGKRAAAMAAADEARRAEEAGFVNTRLAYQDERTPAPWTQERLQQRSTDSPQPLYAELAHEPSKRAPVTKESPVVYAKIDKSRTDYPPAAGVGPTGAELSGTPYQETTTPVNQSPRVKSYVPTVYLRDSPEVHAKQQAVNAQLKDAVRISRNTDF